MEKNYLPDIVKDKAFKHRRFMNWMPLGLIYAFYYMSRYNVSVASADICKMFDWSNAQWGMIITAGFWTYAFSFLINGPLTDKFGGKKAIIIGALGSSAINLLLGVMIGFNLGVKLLVAFSLLYSLNMYFQSFGAVSVVKVNSSWFHINERGTFGGIFGILISLGYSLAYGVGGLILANFDIQYVFIIPGLLLLLMIVVSNALVKDTPAEAGFQNFDTGDATSGDEKPYKLADIMKQIFSTKTIMIIALAEFCTGIVRNGVMQWFPKYMDNVFHVGKNDPSIAIYGILLTLVGLFGGIAAGYLSDKYFDSRRPPVAGVFYIAMILSLLLLAFANTSMLALGAAVIVSFFFIGVHGILSGTASMDFGGTKAAATATGMIDGFVYFGSGFSGFFLGWALDVFGWGAWAYMLLPFAVIGFILTLFVWNEKPKAGGAAH